MTPVKLLKLAQKNNVVAVRKALKDGFDINIMDEDDMTVPAYYVHTGRNAEILNAFIEGGLDLNAPFGGYGRTLLTEAIAGKNTECADLLIKLGADVNAVDFSGQSVLISAVMNKESFETIKMLIDAGADVLKTDWELKNAFIRALELQSERRIVDLLSVAGKDEKTGYTCANAALNTAVIYCDEEKIGLLLENGTDIDAKEPETGKTALMYAVEKGDVKTAKLLLSYGAGIDVADQNGKTAEDYAREQGQHRLVEIFGSVRRQTGKEKNG